MRVHSTCLARYFDGHPSTRTNGQCKRRDLDSEAFGVPPPTGCTYNTRWSCRGRTSYPWIGLLWPATSMATHERARMDSASDVTGTPKFREDPRLLFAPTTPGDLHVDANHGLGFDVIGQILLWPPKHAREWSVQAEWMGNRDVWGTPPSVCTNHTRSTRRGRPPYPSFGLLWPHTSMATHVRARMASARCLVGMHKC